MSKILIVDIETTGFSPTKNKIVEIGIVSLDLLNGEIEILFNQLVKESGMTLEQLNKSWIVKNEFIKYNDIINANWLSDYFVEIQTIFESYPLGITAFNNSFDLGFLKARGFNWHKTLPCPMKLSQKIVRARDKNGSVKMPNAQETYNYFFPGSKYVEKHRGADDAKHEAEIVYKLYRMGIFRL
jgi:DNA polymerase III epsilon subunit-like protein